MIQKILSRINLDKNTWQLIDLKQFNDLYLIAIKDKKAKEDTIDPKNIKKIRYELAIESGVKDTPLTIQNGVLNFDDLKLGQNKLNEISAFVRLMNVPNQVYFKVSSIEDNQKEYTQGITSISINANIVDLG